MTVSVRRTQVVHERRGVGQRCTFAILMGVSDPDADPHRRQHGARARRHPGRVDRAAAPRLRPRRGRRALRDAVRRRAGTGRPPARRGGRRVRTRAGPARSRPHPPLHAGHRHGREGTAAHVRAGAATGRVRPAARRTGDHPGRVAESRLGSSRRACYVEDGVADRHVGGRALASRSPRSRLSAARSRPTVIDRAIQLFGGAGVTNDWPLAEIYTHARTLHLVDGPDEVHVQQIARRELRAYE